MAANESSKYTHFSNVAIGTASGGGGLQVGGTTLTATMAEINDVADKSAAAVVALTADASLTQASHAGKIVTLGSADGDTVTLPAATGTGNVYTIVVATTVTSNSHIIQVANATDEFVGQVYQADTDTSDALVVYPALDGDGYDTITMDGSTTGGLQGDKYVITDIAAGKFQLEGHQNGTGTVATPLSAAVS
jgi:hypothetical protein